MSMLLIFMRSKIRLLKICMHPLVMKQSPTLSHTPHERLHDRDMLEVIGSTGLCLPPQSRSRTRWRCASAWPAWGARWRASWARASPPPLRPPRAARSSSPTPPGLRRAPRPVRALLASWRGDRGKSICLRWP